jgi:predicted GNAT family acetyltransferase
VDIVLRDDPDAHRYELHVGDERAAIVEYRDRPDARLLLHTEVDERFAGRGLGVQLVRYVLDDARHRDRAILPYCPFVRDYIAHHSEYLDLVPAERRARFDL